jgi:hypothetical protein
MEEGSKMYEIMSWWKHSISVALWFPTVVHEFLNDTQNVSRVHTHTHTIFVCQYYFKEKLYRVVEKRHGSFKCQFLLKYCTDINEFGVVEHVRSGSVLFKWRYIQYVIFVHPVSSADINWNFPSLQPVFLQRCSPQQLWFYLPVPQPYVDCVCRCWVMNSHFWCVLCSVFINDSAICQQILAFKTVVSFLDDPIWEQHNMGSGCVFDCFRILHRLNVQWLRSFYVMQSCRTYWSLLCWSSFKHLEWTWTANTMYALH